LGDGRVKRLSDTLIVMTKGTGKPPAPVRVYVEEGARRTFAMAVDLPGWGRSGRGEEAALEALTAYRSRYADVARAAHVRLPAERSGLEIVERLPGNATTDFGAPGVIPALDVAGWGEADVEAQLRLLAAAWQRLDDAAAAAPPALAKGPRGGGRDRDAVVEHVLGVEPAYARKAGLKVKAPADRAGSDALRATLLDHLRAGDGTAPSATGWAAPYVVRRLAWHALDHAWEIEDRSSAG
jgi:hypothetical protein